MSFFYNIDARVKLFFILLFTLVIFLVNKLSAAVFLLIFFIIFRLIAKIPFRFTSIFGPLTLLVVFIIAIQALFAPGDSYIVKPVFMGWGSITQEGLILGVLISCRLAVLLLILPFFTETTPPGKISSGLCALGLNYRAAFIITTAFNLIPVFRDEALVIMDAQKIRGARKFGIRAYTGFLLPLMLGAMRKAQISSVSMDSRAFGVYKTRTWIEKPGMRKGDWLFLASCLVFSAGLLFFNYI